MEKKIKNQENTSLKKIPTSYAQYFQLRGLSASVNEIEMSVRTAYLLKKLDIRSIGDLVQKTEEDLLREGVGRKSIFELKEILVQMGLSLGMSLENLQFKSTYDPYFILEGLSASVDEIEMSVRTAYLLKKLDIRSIGDLVQKTEEDLLREGVGRKSIFELKEILVQMGLSLGMSLENLQFKPIEDGEKYEFVGIGFFGNRLKLVSLHRDGRFVFLDEINSYGGLYVVTSETLALKEAVEELETLINDKDTKEADLQDFFERNTEFILNDEYKKAHSKIVLENRKHENLVPDFILEPYNMERLCDILDLKLPSAKVWVLKKNRPRFSYAVLEASAQLREYAQFLEDEENRLRILSEYGLLAYRPKLFVIIGRRGKVDPIIRKRIEGDIPNVSVLTYDDVMERIKQKIILREKGLKKID